MEGYLRLILLGAAFVIILFIAVEAVMTRRRKYKLANLSENFTSPIQIDHDDDLDLDGNEPQIHGEDDGREYYLAERAPPPSAPEKYADKEANDKEEVMVVTRPAITAPKAPQKITTAPEYGNDLLVLTIAAKTGMQFGSYDLLQSIYAAGLEFGDMNIFHYYATDYAVGEHSKVRLFSLASATEPGEFDLDRIGNYFCSGLTLFSQLEHVPDPREAFNLMLKAAEHLADDLNGELRAGPRRPWDDNALREYQQKTLYFQKLKMNA